MLASKAGDEADLGRPAVEVKAVLESWPGIFYQDGAVIRFWGLALGSTSHAFTISGMATASGVVTIAVTATDTIGAKGMLSVILTASPVGGGGGFGLGRGFGSERATAGGDGCAGTGSAASKPHGDRWN